MEFQKVNKKSWIWTKTGKKLGTVYLFKYVYCPQFGAGEGAELAGLQVALGSAWATIVAAEMIRSSEGVGWLIVSGQDIGNMTQIMVGIVAIALTGLLITTLMRVIEAKLCAWTVRGK